MASDEVVEPRCGGDEREIMAAVDRSSDTFVIADVTRDDAWIEAKPAAVRSLRAWR